MAKYCGYCGSPLDDTARVCGNCGTPVPLDDEKAKSKKNTLHALILIAIIIILAFAAFKLVTGFIGPNAFVRKVMNAYEDYDIDALVDMASDLYMYSSYTDIDQTYEGLVNIGMEQFEDTVGHNYKLSYSIKETYEISDRKWELALQNLRYHFGDFDLDVIDKLLISEVEMTAKQGSRAKKTSMEIWFSKENGKWRLIGFEYD